MASSDTFTRLFNCKQVKLIFLIVTISNLALIDIISSQYVPNRAFGSNYFHPGYVQHETLPEHLQHLYPETVHGGHVPNYSLEFDGFQENPTQMSQGPQQSQFPPQTQQVLPPQLQQQLMQLPPQMPPLNQPMTTKEVEPKKKKTKKSGGLLAAVSEVTNSFTTMNFPHFMHAIRRGRLFDQGGGLMPYAALFLAAYSIDSMLRNPAPPPQPIKLPPFRRIKELGPPYFGKRKRRQRRRKTTTTAAPPPPTTLNPHLAHFEFKTPLGSINVATNKDHKLLQLFGKRLGQFETTNQHYPPPPPSDSASSESIESRPFKSKKFDRIKYKKN